MPFTLSSPVSPEGSFGAFSGPDRTSHATTDTSMSHSHNHSPLASHDGARGLHPIMMEDEFQLTPKSDSAHYQDQDRRSASRRANHGSAQPSIDKKHGGGDYFGFDGPNQNALDRLPEEQSDSVMDVDVDGIADASTPVTPARTATLDSNKAVLVPGQDRRVVTVDVSAMQPAIQSRHAAVPMGFAEAIKVIKRAGHPVHLLTTVPDTEGGLVREWLAALDISVGFGSDDGVAAVWHVPAGDENAKIGVVRALNAAYYCAVAKRTDIALVELAKNGDLEWCFAVQTATDGDTALGTNEGHFTPLSGPSTLDSVPIRSVQGWMGVGAALAEAKQGSFTLSKQKAE